MSRFVRFCLIVLTFTTLLASQQNERALPMVVTTTWLAERLNDPDLVILHVASTRRDYLTAHIPGARFLWVGWFAVSNPDLSL